MGAVYVALLTLKTRLTTDREKGATAVEYGLLVGLIAVVIIVAVTALGTNLDTMFTTISDKLAPAPVTTTG